MSKGLDTCDIAEVRLSLSRTVQLREYHPVTMKMETTIILGALSDPDTVVKEGYAWLESEVDANLSAYLTKLQSEAPSRVGMTKKSSSPLNLGQRRG